MSALTPPRRPLLLCLGMVILFCAQASSALATQTHGQPEGLVVHQLAHLFFIISMGILEFWLRKRNLVQDKGWRFIHLSAVFFLLWNLDAMLVHFLEEQVHLLQTGGLSLWKQTITTPEGFAGLGVLYYLAKFDHLLCVPAMFFLFYGLRTLNRQAGAADESGDRS